ncbi:unnamed protein product [Discosporangium mesarthrocarpum]
MHIYINQHTSINTMQYNSFNTLQPIYSYQWNLINTLWSIHYELYILNNLFSRGSAFSGRGCSATLSSPITCLDLLYGMPLLHPLGACLPSPLLVLWRPCLPASISNSQVLCRAIGRYHPREKMHLGGIS